MGWASRGFRYAIVGSWDFLNFLSTVSLNDRPSFLSLGTTMLLKTPAHVLFFTCYVMKYSLIQGGILWESFFKGLPSSCWYKGS